MANTISQYLIVSLKSYQFCVHQELAELEWLNMCEDIVSDTTDSICVKFWHNCCIYTKCPHVRLKFTFNY